MSTRDFLPWGWGAFRLLRNECGLHDIEILWSRDGENMFAIRAADFDKRAANPLAIEFEFFVTLFTLNNHAWASLLSVRSV